MKVKKKLAAGAGALALSVGLGLGVAPAAQANANPSLHQVDLIAHFKSKTSCVAWIGSEVGKYIALHPDLTFEGECYYYKHTPYPGRHWEGQVLFTW